MSQRRAVWGLAISALWGLGLAGTGCGRFGYEAAELSGSDGGGPGFDGGVSAGDGGVRVEAAVCGDGVVEGAEVCDDGDTLDTGSCNADCSVRLLCGDGVVGDGEQCDDGNGVDGDGCDGDCSFSCETDAACDDGLTCNGVEACAANRCVAGDPIADGSECTTGICRSGSCAPASCGNDMLDPGEDCDDGNTVDGDGCDNDCTFSCDTDMACDDGRECNGVETCFENVCLAGSPLPDLTLCDRDGLDSTDDICVDGDCVRSVCGDMIIDTLSGEECDDGNLDNGDGCDNDCTFSCTADAECDDGLACNGAESCASNRCEAGVAPPDGTACTGGICSGGSCVPLRIDGGLRFDGGSGTCGGATCGAREHCCCNSCIPFTMLCMDVICPPES